MQDRGIIQPSCSPWAAPIVPVRKRDGGLRFCVDYRKLNDVTRKDAYPLPRIDDALDSLANAKWFSTLDLESGYWQVEVAPKDKAKTAFITRQGLIEFNVLAFGLTNGPSTFQRLMDLVLSDLQWTTCLVYLDDIIVFGRTFEEHLSRLGEVLSKLKTANLKVKPSKCNLFSTEVQYLGHVISAEGVKADPGKVEAVRAWPVPINQTEVRSFLGLASYYRRFVRGFAEIARPLHQLTEKGKRFKWDEACQRAFVELKTHLISAPILAYPDPKKVFILDTDASDFGIGAVLSQEVEGLERVVAYASRALSKAERRYATTKKEGRQHGNADALSRIPVLAVGEGLSSPIRELGVDGPVGDVGVKMVCACGSDQRNPVGEERIVDVPLGGEEELKQAQQEDLELKLLLQVKGCPVGRLENIQNYPSLKKYATVWDQLKVQDGRLVRVPPEGKSGSGRVQVVLPKSMVPIILEMLMFS